MSLASEIASGEICRRCQLPLESPAPGFSRMCEDCFPGEYIEEWERAVGPIPLHPDIKDLRWR